MSRLAVCLARAACFALALLLMETLRPAPATAQDATPTPDTTWSTFAPGVISLPDVRETSPTMTADGQTMAFARTTNWTDKVPYLATRTADGWDVRRAPFADTLYNLAIAPDGQTVFFKTNETQSGEDVSRVYRVERREDGGWGEPQNLPALFNIHAGYVCPMADGTLYLFARSPQPGIYRTTPDGTGGYTDPEWVSDAVSPTGTTTFDVLVHPNEDRLIVTRSVSGEGDATRLGPRGFYYHERTDAGWTDGTRLPLPYGWGATALPGGHLLFVDAGDLQTVPFADLGIAWPTGE